MVLVAFVEVEFPVMFKFPLTVDDAVEMKPPTVASPEPDIVVAEREARVVAPVTFNVPLIVVLLRVAVPTARLVEKRLVELAVVA